MSRAIAASYARRMGPRQWLTGGLPRRGGSTTTPTMSLGFSVGGTLSFASRGVRAGAVAERGPKPLGLLASLRLSGEKKESWNTLESCHKAVRSRRRVATVLDRESRAWWMLGAG
jgi:hypothetical protein